MFFSIPVNSTQIVTTTPLEARSITHLFFESKNGGIFNYKKEQDNVTITVDGKMICRNVPILPFCTSTPYGINRHDWRDIALEVGLNVNLSEVKISAQNINDFNVVFVCSSEPIADFKGFDFVEAFRIKLREIPDRDTLMAYAEEGLLRWKDTREPKEEGKYYNGEEHECVELKLSDDKTENNTTIKGGTYENPDKIIFWGDDFKYPRCHDFYSSPTPNLAYAKRLADMGDVTLSGPSGRCYLWEPSHVREVKITSSPNPYHYYYYLDEQEWLKYAVATYLPFDMLNSTTGEWRKEKTLALDRAPERFFAMQVCSDTQTVANPKVLQASDIRLNFSLSGGDEQEFEPQTDIDIVQHKDNVPWRKVVHTFGQTMPRSIQFTYDYNRNNPTDATPDLKNNTVRSNGYTNGSSLPKTWDLYLFFIYKKVI